MKTKSIFIIAAFFVFQNSSSAQIINTIMKNGDQKFVRDWYAALPDDVAKTARINDIMVDSIGNIYFSNDSRIQKLDKLSGKTVLIAGNGIAAYSGDGFIATDASLGNPTGMCFDKNGDLLFCDNYNFRIRKINHISGIISTIAGTGIQGFEGDGGLAINAKLGYCYGITADNFNNILFADATNNRIRKINTVTGIVSTLVSGPLNQPMDVISKKNGELFISDYNNKLIRKYNPLTGNLSVYAGGGSLATDTTIATSVWLTGPGALALDDSENLYFTDFYVLRKVNKSNQLIYNIAGQNEISGFEGDEDTAKGSLFKFFDGVAIDPKNKSIYINDKFNFRLRSISNVLPPVTQRNIEYCQFVTADTFVVTGHNLKWYTNAFGGPAIPKPTINSNISDTNSYFVSQTIAGVESSRAAVVSKGRTADTTIILERNINICQGSEVDVLYNNIAFTGFPHEMYLFYNRNLTDTIKYTGKNLAKAGPGKVFALLINEFGCPNPVDSFDCFVKAKPPVPEFISPFKVCRGDTKAAFSATEKSAIFVTDTFYNLPHVLKPNTYSVQEKYFYVYQTDDSGCNSDFGTLKVVINPVPTEKPNVITPVTYCQDEMAIPFSASGNHLAWYNSDNILITDKQPMPSTAVPGTFRTMVCAVNEFNCKGPFSDIITSVLPKPSIEITTDHQDAYRAGYPISLSAKSNIGQTFLWNNGQRNSSFNYLPSEKGKLNFWVVTTSESGCKSDTARKELSISAEYYWEANYEVFPNPFTDYIKVSGLNLSDIYSINLRKTNGELIAKSMVNPNSYILNIPSNLPSGYYLLQVETIGSAKLSKIIFKQ